MRRIRHRLPATALAWMLAAGAAAAATPAATSAADAPQRIAYGEAPSQFGELRVPAGPGPHPVVVLVHGGCWRADYADLGYMRPIADALAAGGIASWNIEYRRLPEPGSGWPGTFTDVGAAIDALGALAPAHRLDLARVVVVGHSVGGHLALWAAARGRLPRASVLHARAPLPLRGVVDLGGAADLGAERRVERHACDGRVVETLLGGDPGAVPARYAQVSATTLLPLRVPQVLVWGGRDDIAPLWLATRHRDAARRAGDPVRLVLVPGIGHFDLPRPGSAAWPAIRAAILGLLGPAAPAVSSAAGAAPAGRR
ncbi:MAG: alpha/beta hydrolase family protein [Lysobacteraceae bacterium]